MTDRYALVRMARAQAIFAQRWPSLRWMDYVSRNQQLEAFRLADAEHERESERP